MGSEQLRTFYADGPITKRCTFGGAGNDTNVPSHGPILQSRCVTAKPQNAGTN